MRLRPGCRAFWTNQSKLPPRTQPSARRPKVRIGAHIADRPARERAQAADRVGQFVEPAPTEAVFARPRHPYTAALMRAVPVPDPRVASSNAILKGEVLSLAAPPSARYFHPRCPFAEERCRREAPLLRELSPRHFARCHFAEQLSLQGA
jgi:oligopeptide/dipeptide ABC transporter ATP-binding protein